MSSARKADKARYLLKEPGSLSDEIIWK